MPRCCFSNFTKMLWNHVFRAYDALVALVFQLTLLLAFWVESRFDVKRLSVYQSFAPGPWRSFSSGKHRVEIFSQRHQSDTNPEHADHSPVQIRTFPQRRGSLFGPGVLRSQLFETNPVFSGYLMSMSSHVQPFSSLSKSSGKVNDPGAMLTSTLTSWTTTKTRLSDFPKHCKKVDPASISTSNSAS